MITVTPKAAERLREMMAEEKKNFLRVYVQGGGCSGFQYGLMLDEGPGSEGELFDSNGIKLLVDPISISYLKDAEVDFEENSTGGGFTIKNPNAKSTCGCGSSFNTE
ncbi:MAG: hypothetical protein A3B86_01955 [Candidatus Yanofskybacteria bacterium RIFCSPHIGHO2_02_FULL_38_22b]|uniref:Core domain-containing protein n=1 Tax=Candidatus Yanofskybacteria bacterium RIFCSPHIGHO2_02_FULL_38_22b TaxID=1802673 RepID=A0A1F8F1Y9_9BACT|nr:MAG: hypothetical protein A2816_00855 [Candidatus Yanofskybacteria bacterium RIFCSPHIGHO2_01_FULL_39_44]OGN07151.1 MAG: hypothetical protein A3B86_01955 [Candidatus Yanofskybacteria bacterium RIFCSPHIGHO2_02_FULL_38_22b]OGN20001.1 MAG: hypothetical protein A2910_00665 [Candidatus Yanofskybacteria bacterium RIFCSPLOWO2_01_FULL_39_28]